MSLLIPILSSLLFRAGGTDQWKWCPLNQKWWRWLIGLPIGIISYHDPIRFVCVIISYFIVTNCCPYGEKSWLNFLGRDLKWITYGLLFGSCSWLVLLPGYALIQGLLGALSFWVLMKLSNDGLGAHWYGEITNDDYWKNRMWYLDQQYVELTFGLLGTVMYVMGR